MASERHSIQHIETGVFYYYMNPRTVNEVFVTIDNPCSYIDKQMAENKIRSLRFNPMEWRAVPSMDPMIDHGCNL